MNASTATATRSRRRPTGETQAARLLHLLRDLADELEGDARLDADDFEGTLDLIDADEFVSLVIPGCRFTVGQAISFLESRARQGGLAD